MFKILKRTKEVSKTNASLLDTAGENCIYSRKKQLKNNGTKNFPIDV